MTPPSCVVSLSFFCLLVLLLVAQHGAAASYASYKLGSRQVIFKAPSKSPGNSQQASTVPTAATPCSSTTTTGQDNNRLPVVHRLRHDASPIQHRFASPLSQVAPSPAATIIPTHGTPSALPGTLDYTVLVSYGTPKQTFPVLLDIGVGFSTSVLHCKPCASDSKDCDPAFDTSRSSTFTHVLCGSPDCPTNCSGGSVCPFINTDTLMHATYAQDVLTLAPSMAVDKFRVLCKNVAHPSDPYIGILDLSRDRNSLPSRLSSSSFSYCLPHSPTSEGFLYLGGNATTRENNHTVHAPLVSNKDPALGSMYFIDLVGMSLGDDKELAIPVGTFGGNATAMMSIRTTFTRLAPDAYTELRDSFRRQMSQYNHLLLPETVHHFDTCYNFTGLRGFTVPVLAFKFGNGESLVMDVGQMLYFDNPDASTLTVTCLAFSALHSGNVFSAVIGAHTLVSTEVVYDVAGGKVGFIPSRC